MNKNRTKTYNKKARAYPAIISMFIPCILFCLMVTNSNLLAKCNIIWKFLTFFIPSAFILGAIGYFMREVFIATSKLIIQTPLYKNIETYFPTTKFLLWKNKHYSTQTLNQIRNKIFYD